MNRLITSIIVILSIGISLFAQKAQIKVGYNYHFSIHEE